MAAIASSATSVLIAHVAAHTRSIRVGSGGIMLPNHAPLMIAEQFGTLESLHPGRIDLEPRSGAGDGSRHDSSAAISPGARRDLSERCARAPGLPERHPGGCGSDAGEGHERAALHPWLFPVRRPAGGGARLALRVRFAFRSGRARRGRCAVPSTISAFGAASSAVRDRGRKRDRRGFCGRGRRPVSSCAAGARQDPARPRARLGRRTSRHRPFVAGGSEHCGHGHVHGARHRGPKWPSTLGEFASHAHADELITVHPGPTVEDRLRSLEIAARCARSLPSHRRAAASVKSLSSRI